MEFVLFFLGIPLGIFASLIAWWLITHMLKPKILIGGFISKVRSDDSTSYKYRYALKNNGKRNVLNISSYCRLNIKGINPNITMNKSVFTLKGKSVDFKPFMEVQATSMFAINLNNIPKRLYELAHVTEFSGLEEILQLGEDAFLSISIIATDEFTGATKLFRSKDFRLNDIKGGYYNPDSLKFKEIEEYEKGEKLEG